MRTSFFRRDPTCNGWRGRHELRAADVADTAAADTAAADTAIPNGQRGRHELRAADAAEAFVVHGRHDPRAAAAVVAGVHIRGRRRHLPHAVVAVAAAAAVAVAADNLITLTAVTGWHAVSTDMGFDLFDALTQNVCVQSHYLLVVGT